MKINAYGIQFNKKPGYLHQERDSRITANPVQNKDSLTTRNSFSYNLPNSLNGWN